MQARAFPIPSKCLANRSRASPFVRNALHSSTTVDAADVSKPAEGAAAPENLAEEAARASSATVLTISRRGTNDESRHLVLLFCHAQQQYIGNRFIH